MQDDAILASPATELPLVRALGATTVRVFLTWYSLAPEPEATQPPAGFDGSDPNAYSASKWLPYDLLVDYARRDGITVDFELTGGSPRWASGTDPPPSVPGYTDDRRYYSWEPNPAMYGQFVHAVAERYDGTFTPPGSDTALPRVHFWSFWNEPNFGQQLGPQATDGSTVSASAPRYRALLDAAWTAVQQTGHAQDTTLIGEIAAKGYGLRPAGHPGPLPGNTAQTRALDFVRYLYCLDADDRPLRGIAATQIGCPADAAGSRQFRAQNPALFDATGFAVHAYDSKEAPDANPATIDANDATLPVLGRVATALDRITGAYGSAKHFPIYNDEFGYITSPPQAEGNGDPSPARAAVELNQAEYISYENPRVAAYSQYVITDPPPNPNPGFSSGLYTSNRHPKGDPVRVPDADLVAEHDRASWREHRDLGRRAARCAHRPDFSARGHPDAARRPRPLEDDHDGGCRAGDGIHRHPHHAALQRQPAPGLHLSEDRLAATPRASRVPRSSAGRSHVTVTG